MASGDTAKLRMWDPKYRRLGQRNQSPARSWTYYRRQVGHVPRNIQARKLPGTVTVVSETPNGTVNDEAGMIDHFAKTNEIDMGDKLLSVPLQAEDRRLFLGSEDRS